jgi:sugar phosphate isomerase/epimerase
MRLGIMATTFARPTLEATLDEVPACGVRSVQFDLACAGLPTLPAQIAPALCGRVRDAFAARGLTMEALSGTFNMIHPEPSERAEGLRRLRVLLDACGALGTTVVTLCTGTRDPHHMWRRHPENDAPEAWTDLVASMREAVRGAEAAGVTLAFEPEVANVVDSAHKARRLLDEIGSPRLKVVLDGANIFHSGELPRMREMLKEACALLGPDIALAHAKDLDHDGEAGHLPAGRGLLDYPLYLALLRRSGFTGALILHGLAEEDVAACLAFVRAAAPEGLWSATSSSLKDRGQ